MKRMLSVIMVAIICVCAVVMTACTGESDVEKLTANPWSCSTDILEFTDKGRILWNFEGLLDSVSYYKLLKGNKINMYTEEGEEYGIILDYRFEGEKLYIGEVEYTPLPTDEELLEMGKSDSNDVAQQSATEQTD